MLVLGWIFGVIVAILLIAIAVYFLNRFYRKSSRDVALIRTGFGGQKIIISGGCLALPFLHRVDEVNMRTVRIEVKRTGEKSLITEDRMRVDAELEFYIRVHPSIEGIATAAQALGTKSFTPDGIRNLLEGRFVDAIQSVAASQTMDTLHEKRGEFVRRVADVLRDNLVQNGLLLDAVSLTRLDQAAFASLDENNAFNAVGMRKLAEIIAVNKKKRAEIEADADISVRQTQLEAIKRRLTLGKEEEQAQIAQRLDLEKTKAASDAEAARAREESTIAADAARIARERDTRAAEITKQRELRRLEIEAQLNSEMNKVDSSIKLAAKQVDEAKAQAAAELARTEVILAQEKVQTDRERAVAERSHELALKRVAEAGDVAERNAQTETDVLLKRAKAEADAVRTRAEAERLRLLAHSEGEKAAIAAKNSRSDALMHLELEQYRLDKLPAIVEQMMKPAEKIDSIRIHQVTGFGGGVNGPAAGESSSKPPVNQVMDSIMGMALQLPALKSIGESIGMDLSKAVPPSISSTPGPARPAGDA